MRPFEMKRGRRLALAALACCVCGALGAAVGCAEEKSGPGKVDAGKGGATSVSSGKTSSSTGKTSSSTGKTSSSVATSSSTGSATTTSSSTGSATTTSSGGVTSGDGGVCSPAIEPDGAPLSCAGLPSTGGEVVWSAVVPAPMSGSPWGAPEMWSLQGIFAGATGHAFVAIPYATPSSFGGPAGIALDEIDAAGHLLGDRGPSDPAVSFTLRGAGVFGARHYVIGVSFAEWAFSRSERVASDAAYVDSHRTLLDSGVLRAATGDDLGDTFAVIGAGQNPNPDAVGWGMCWGAEWGNFLVKWSASGEHAWTVPLPAYAAFPTSFAADGDGGIYVAGARSGQVDLGCVAPSSGASYVSRIGASGVCTWIRGLSLGTGPLVMVPAAKTGDLYLSNTFQGTIDVGCGPMSSGAGTSAYVARFDPGGICLYSRSFAVDNLGVALFPSGDVLLSTSTGSAVSFGGGTLAAVGVADAVVTRLDVVGQHVWSRRFGTPGATVSCAGAYADDKGGVVLPCTYAGAVDFGGGPLAGGALVKLDGLGVYRWGRAPAVGGVASDPCGAVLAASTCATCAPSGAPGVTVTKLAP